MANYADQFAREVQARKEELARFLSLEAHDGVEERLKGAIAGFWHSFPQELGPGGKRPEYAVDGSTASRDFSNSVSMLVVQALLLGPGLQEPRLGVRFLRGNVPRPVVERYQSLLMRLQELEVALEHLGKLGGGILYLDGSLAAALPHLLYPLELKGEEALPLRLLRAQLDLIERCQEKDILLLALSKTSRDTFLASTILGFAGGAEAEAGGSVPPDVEMLARWTQGVGFSTPILLGLHSLGHRWGDFLSSPERLCQAFPEPGSAIRELGRLRQSPAIASFHLRLTPGGDTLRVDVPAPYLGLSEKVEDLDAQPIPPERVHGMLRVLMDAYGGPEVYNAALYVADKEVRLSREVVDGAFLSILRSLTGAHLEYDRSTRRFF